MTMLALFQKDCIVIYKTSRMLLLAVALFVVMGGARPDQLFFAVYPPIVLTAMALTTLSYDERSRWQVYADTLPCGRRKVVGSKYLLALAGCIGAIVLLAASCVGFGLARGNLDLDRMLWMLNAVLLAGTVHSAVMLPVSFKFGTDKGRIVYLLCLCAFFALAWMPVEPRTLQGLPWMALLPLLCAGLWAGSYLIAAAVYEKRVF